MKRLILLIVIYILLINVGAQTFILDTIDKYSSGISIKPNIVFYYKGKPIPEISLYWWDKYCQELKKDSIEVCALLCWTTKYNNGKYEEWQLDTIYNKCEFERVYHNAYKCRDKIYVWIPRNKPTFEGFMKWLRK